MPFAPPSSSRMPGGWTDSGEGSPSPASSSIGLGAGVETPPEPSRPAPVLDRRDSNRSLSGRIQRRDSSKVSEGGRKEDGRKRGDGAEEGRREGWGRRREGRGEGLKRGRDRGGKGWCGERKGEGEEGSG